MEVKQVMNVNMLESIPITNFQLHNLLLYHYTYNNISNFVQLFQKINYYQNKDKILWMEEKSLFICRYGKIAFLST